MKVTLIISTCGRTLPLLKLFDSLVAQTFQDFEVIIVDQNKDDTLQQFLGAHVPPFALKHVRTPTETGLSQGRNTGLKSASGSIVVFPDDDCWYPPGFLAYGVETMERLATDIFAGRAANEAGESINGRFETEACRIDRRNVWTTGIEWVVFFKRSALEAVKGFDPAIGVGARTPWQSCEGQDVMLRALDRGLACSYDPALFGHHARFSIDAADAATCRKGRAYGRGLGYVLRKHDYTFLQALGWIARAVFRALQSLLQGRLKVCRYYWNVALGRSEGWLNIVWD
jgi:glycosyltransferase involved in cell wall biosynthesis